MIRFKLGQGCFRFRLRTVACGRCRPRHREFQEIDRARSPTSPGCSGGVSPPNSRGAGWQFRDLYNGALETDALRKSPRFETSLQLKNYYGISYADEIFHTSGVPIGEANATVAGSAANCLRIICAVNTDSGFVQAHP